MALHVDHSHTRLIGIIGRSIGHTLSPLMHNTAFKQLNLNFAYGVFQISPEMIRPLISTVKSREIRGANVTIPYKQEVMQYLDHIAIDARTVGAVNTIVNDHGVLTGYNTDVDGVRGVILPYSNEIEGRSIVILGAGGAARAAIHAVATSCRPKRIVIVNRTIGTAERLANDMRSKYENVEIVAAVNTAASVREIGSAVMIINATSVGMWPVTEASPLPSGVMLRPDQIVFDTIYSPMQTTLLRTAALAGARTLSGFEMLLMQGARAFALFTGHTFPMESARAAVLNALTQEQYA
jgi:shikimate dehydrogenase